jgi:putative endonuclease
MYYVYLSFLNNGNVYTGSTKDLKRRIESGKVTSTKHKRPLNLIAYEAYLLKTDATRRERFLKTTEGKRLLKLQLKDCLEKFKARRVA